MPREYYYPLRLTQKEVIELFRKGKYIVDSEKGIVLNGKTKKPLHVFAGGHKAGKVFVPNYNSKWVRLYSAPKHIALPVSHCIWLANAKVTIPNGFEIHHKDLDSTNNAWNNLFCLFDMDHRKLHQDHRLICNGEEPEEETPF